MTSTPSTPAQTTTGTTHRNPTHTAGAVDRFLAAVAAGTAPPAEIYADDAALDATVPGWRFTVKGAAAISEQYAGWFRDPARLVELRRLPTPTGEVIAYYHTWEEAGSPWAANHCHLIELDDEGRIVSDSVFCGGRWDAETLAQIERAG